MLKEMEAACSMSGKGHKVAVSYDFYSLSSLRLHEIGLEL